MYHCIPQADRETVALSVYRTIELSIPRADRETVAVSVYRTLDLSSIVELSQYRSLEHCGVIASHIRPLPQKEGVWEDMRMLKFASGGCASKAGLGVQTMPKYDGTLPKVIASDSSTVLQYLLESPITRQFYTTCSRVR